MNKKISGWLFAVAGLLMTACSNDVMEGSGDDISSEDYVTVSFNVTPAGRVISTRAEDAGQVHYPDTDGGEFPQISDGSKAHLLIYAVYDKEHKLLDQYGKGVDASANGKIADGKVGTGQTVLYIDKFPTAEIHLRLMRKQTYNIAFWAQDEKCTVYNTEDLTKVKVDYSDAKNNDELRDAFCKVETFTVAGDETRDIILTRPLAQINVGTAGYDFESLVTKGDYIYSQISLSGVSQYLDVVSNKVLNDEDLASHDITGSATTDVTYGWSRIPAYINYGADSEVTPSTAQFPTEKDKYYTYKEQFLRVDLDWNGEYKDYVSLNQVSDANKYPDTEVFKYLSMCYVLVPAHEVKADDNKTPDDPNYKDTSHDPTSYGTTITVNSVSIATDANGNDGHQFITSLNNVPVQRNWRTNILGRNWFEAPSATFRVDIVPDYNGEWNYKGEENGQDKWEDDEGKPYEKK